MKPDDLNLIPLHTGALGLRAQLSVTCTAPPDTENKAGDTLDMVASDETIDRYSEVIRADGWDLTQYKRNPVIQNSHRYDDIMFTLGKAMMTEVRDGKLMQRWQFAVAENPFAKIAAGLYRGGYLRASSVGFIPREWQRGKAKDDGTYEGPRRIYTKQELLEVSAVGIPANPNALVMGLKSGAIETADLQECALLLQSICTASSTAGRKAEEFPNDNKAGTRSNAPAPGSIANGADALAEQLQEISQGISLLQQLHTVRDVLRRA